MRICEAFADHLDEPFEVERFENGVTNGPVGDLIHAPFPCGCEDDDVRWFWLLHVDTLDELITIEARHHQVEQDEIKATVMPNFFERHQSVLGELDLEVHSPQHGL